MLTFFLRAFYKSFLTGFSNKKRTVVDLREWASPVEDQYDLGSCTANAVANAYELLVNMYLPAESVDLSRLFIYYNSRRLEGTVTEDTGAFLSDTLKAAKNFGICAESLWPYDINKFNVKPTEECYVDARKRQLTNFTEVQSADDAVSALNNNQPVVFGLPISKDFSYLSWQDPILKMPDDSDEVGGHAMCMVGYNLDSKMFLVKNSFGIYWGDKGYCWIPFDYVQAKGYDMWTFTLDNN